MDQNYNLQTREYLNDVAQESRGKSRQTGFHVSDRLARVLSMQNDGTYTVQVFDMNGSPGLSIEGVPVIPEGELETGQLVWLYYAAPGARPIIRAMGGNSPYAYWQGYRDAGYWGAVAD